MPYSVEILVIKQENPSRIPFESRVKLEWEGGELGNLRLKKTWPMMSSLPGVWYNIVLKDQVYFNNTALLFDTDYDTVLNTDTYYWIKDNRRKECYTPFIVRDEFIGDVKKVLDFLIKESPIKTLMILPLYERGKIETIQGPILLTDYFELLFNNQIPFNVCSIVKIGD